jgi:hypothetical protein
LYCNRTTFYESGECKFTKPLDIIKLSGKILSGIYPNSCMEADADDECIGDGETTNQENALKDTM